MKNKKLNTIKTTGLKVPDDYFESFEDAVLSQLIEEKHLGSAKSSGFNIPIGYFDTVEDSTFNKLQEPKPSNIIQLLRWKKVAYISGIAASIILAFNLIFINTDDLTIEDVETASIQNYLLNEELSVYELAPYLASSELDSENFIEHTINASDIEAYLLLNSDVEQLIID